MKTVIRYRSALWLMLLSAFFSLIPTSVFAASNAAYFTPASGTAQTNKSFSVSVDGTVSSYWWGGGPNSANGVITFPANLLKVTSVNDKSGASFPSSTTTIDNSAGKITFSQKTGQFDYIKANSTVHLLTITFQTIAAGSANVKFSSMQYSTGTAATTGALYTITNPPTPTPTPSPSPSPTPKPTTNPKPSTTPKPSSTPKPSASPAPSTTPTPEETIAPTNESDGGLKIENVKITTTRRENKVTWTTNTVDVTPTLSYGTSKAGQAPLNKITKDDKGGYTAVFENLKPGTLYHFTIKLESKDNLSGATHRGSFTTRGYPVQLTVQQNNLLIPGAKIEIDGRSFVANADAIITTELSDGEHSAKITPPDSAESYIVKFTVAQKTLPASGNPELQSFALNVTYTGSSSSLDNSFILFVIGGVVATTALGGSIIGFLLIRKRNQADQTAAIDSDLLASSYGTDVNEYRQNTPEPNLEMHNNNYAQSIEPTAQAPPNPTPALPTQALEIPTQSYDEPTASPPQTSIQLTPMPAPMLMEQPEASTPSDPTLLPLPPSVVDAQPIQESMLDVSKDPQLSPELTQVEASNQAGTDDEPTAVYHESTGELEIVHHHSAPTVHSLPSPAVATSQITPPSTPMRTT